jgi:hypothetical protein
MLSSETSRSALSEKSSRPSHSHSSQDGSCGLIGCPGCFSVLFASAFEDFDRTTCFDNKPAMIEYYLGSSFAQICGAEGYCSYYYDDDGTLCSQEGGPPAHISVVLTVYVCCGC